jgi:hypothetical protein
MSELHIYIYIYADVCLFVCFIERLLEQGNLDRMNRRYSLGPNLILRCCML